MKALIFMNYTLKKLNDLSGFKKKHIAFLAGMSPSRLAHLENGGDPKLTEARALARVHKQPLDLIFPDGHQDSLPYAQPQPGHPLAA